MTTLSERDLNTCVRCGLCLTACPTYGLTGMEGYSPRGRISASKAVARGPGADLHVLSEYIDTCLGCRACEVVCPSGVPYGRILEGVRAELGPSGGPVRRLIESIVLWVVAKRGRLSLATLLLYPLQRLGLLRLGGWLADRRVLPSAAGQGLGLPPLRLRDALSRLSSNYLPHPDVAERGQVVLFAGCVQDAWARDVHWATIGVLTGLGYRVRVPHGQVCCGALHAHAGRRAAAERLASRNAEPLAAFDGPIVVNAAGCGAKLKEYEDAVASRVQDVHELIDPQDVRRAGARAPEGLRRIAVHDPCHLVVQGVRAQPRALLSAAGYEVVEAAEAPRCCGAAGTHALHHPEWAIPLREQRLEALRATAPDAVAVANPGCQFWMGADRAAPPMYHPIQLVAMAMVEAGA